MACVDLDNDRLQLAQDFFPSIFQAKKPCGELGHRGGSRGRVQGVRTSPPPPRDDLRFSNTTGILQKKRTMDGLVKYANVSLCFDPRCDFFVSSLYFVTMKFKKLFHSIFQGVQHLSHVQPGEKCDIILTLSDFSTLSHL